MSCAVLASLVVGTLGVAGGCRRAPPAERVSEARPELAAQASAPKPAPKATASVLPRPFVESRPGSVRFAAIGDFGASGDDERRVAALVLADKPDFVITLGDNNYPSGGANTIDENVGRFYASLISPYRGRFGPGGTKNRFFPALGNHDWLAPGARPYFDYFTLPGNERYYSVREGNVELFAIDSDPHEPDGITADSAQGRWLKERAVASRAAFRIAYMHHPPYSSGPHGSTPVMQWPYRAWGIDLVLAGHDHDYERLEVGGVTYVVNGLGGNSPYAFEAPVEGSRLRFNEHHGALFLEVSAEKLSLRFVTSDGKKVDELTLTR